VLSLEAVGRRGYRELLKRGVSRDLAWNTAKSAHGPWRLSRSPGLAFALTASYFTELGVPRLYIKGLSHRTAEVRDPYARWCGRGSREASPYPDYAGRYSKSS